MLQLWIQQKKTQDFLLFFHTLSPFSRLFSGLENCWANFSTSLRIQDSVQTLHIPVTCCITNQTHLSWNIYLRNIILLLYSQLFKCRPRTRKRRNARSDAQTNQKHVFQNHIRSYNQKLVHLLNSTNLMTSSQLAS